MIEQIAGLVWCTGWLCAEVVAADAEGYSVALQGNKKRTTL